MRFPDWPRDLRQPRLGDVIAQIDGPGGDPDLLRRSYAVIGIEETRTGYQNAHMASGSSEAGSVPCSTRSQKSR